MEETARDAARALGPPPPLLKLTTRPVSLTPAEDADTSDDEEHAATRAARLLHEQLAREMLKRRPDHFVLGVTCRSLGGVPPELRARVWQELLGVARSERLLLDQSILRVEEDLENQRVISADASRTRGRDLLFQQPETVELVAKILTYYCKCRSIRYKQGMNEVLAPFLLLESDPPLPESAVFQLFYAMIDKFLPHVFADREFKSLQCSFQLYRLLLLYHDPELCHYLDQHDMIPELYVTPWFMTLFARNLSAELVFCLWDFFLLEEDPFLLHFVAYALVAANRRQIFDADVAMLPQVLSQLTFHSRQEMERICADALTLSETTPRSFKRDLYSVCYGGFSSETAPLLQHLYGTSSLQVYPEELVRNLMNRLTNKKNSPHKMRMAMAQSASAEADETNLNPLLSPSSRQSSFSYEREASSASVFFIVLDCRPLEQYQECHLSLSYHIDPEVVASPDALAVLMKGFARMKGCHFCFVGPSDPSWSAPQSSSNGNIAITTIARLARGISGDRSTPSVTSASTATASSNATTLDKFTTEPPVLKASTSNGEPGSLENEIASIGSSSDGRPRWHEEHASVTRLVLIFLQKGFEHISRLNGGFDQLKQEILRMDSFTQEQLLVFAPPPTVAASGSSGAFKLFAKIGLGSRSRTPSSDEANFNESSGAPIESIADSSGVTSGGGTTVKLKATKSVSSTSFSQRFLSLKAAAKDAVASASSSSALTRNATSNGDQREEDDAISESRLVGEEEWLEVCIKTREALEKSLQYKEVVFQAGSLGILFQKSRTSKKFQTVVDSIVPDSQASDSQQIVPGDLLVGVNGQSLADIPFLSVIDMVKDASRPLVLRLQSPKRKKSMDALDAISIPPAAPTLVSATPHSVCVTWTKLPLPNSRYQLQYAYQSEFHFNPWVPAVTKRQGSSGAAELGTSGITEHTNGTMVGLDPGQSLVFRVRCGNGDKWGPYSVSSSAMTTLEKDDSASSSVASDTPQSSPRNAGETGEPRQGPVFLPGVCPSVVEHGDFFFRVLLSLRARKRPEFDAEKLDIVFEKGFILQCDKRIVAPGTNQIFVRLAGSGVSRTNNDAAIGGIVGSEMDDEGVWAFENTLDGALVLERVAADTARSENSSKPSIAIQEQAKAVVSSLLSASGIKSNSAANGGSSGGSTSSSPNTTSSTTSSASPNVASAPVAMTLVPPRILQVFPASETEIVVTWDPINDVGVKKYQIQYSKDRLAAMWWTVKQDIDGDMLKFTVTELLPNTSYLFRVRGGSDEYGWGPYSEPSSSCRTSPLVNTSRDNDSSQGASESDSTADDSATNVAATTPPSLSSTGTRTKTRSSVFTSNNGSSNSLRTGSTILDKAVAVAARLTSSRRRSLSSNSVDTASSSAVTRDSKDNDAGGAGDESSGYSENSVDDLTAIPQYVNLAKWKESSDGASKDFRFYHAAKFESQRGKADGQRRGFADNNVDTKAEVAAIIREYYEQDLERVGERELVLTPSALLLLNSWASSREGISLVEENRPLSSIQRITSVSGLDNSVVFEFAQQNTDEELLTGGTTDVEDSDSERKEGVDVLIVVVHNADAFVGAIERSRTLLA